MKVRGTFEPGTPTYDAVGSIKARWPASVGKGLAGLLQNKLGPEVREMLLQLAALTVEWHGVGWATAAQIAPAPSAAAAASTSASTSESASSTLLSLLVELCCIELRMGLEDRYVIDVLKNGALITACYVIFEAAIAAVVAPNSSTTKLPLEVLERLHGRFGEGLQVSDNPTTTTSIPRECVVLKSTVNEWSARLEVGTEHPLLSVQRQVDIAACGSFFGVCFVLLTRAFLRMTSSYIQGRDGVHDNRAHRCHVQP